MDEDLIGNQKEETPFNDLHQGNTLVEQENAASGIGELSGGGHQGSDTSSAVPEFETTDQASHNNPLVSVETPSAQEQPTTGLAADEPPSIPFDRFKQLQEENESLHNRLLRKQAEFENFRKRHEREKHDFYNFALYSFIKDLLPIIDGLERGLYAPEGETIENHKKGIELILKEFRDVLALAGLQPIRAMGRIFDPDCHQAIAREETNYLPENEIIEELQRGYTFKDRLLRPSIVKVAAPVSLVSSGDNPVET
jgi:molecular chaperone GrpE